MQLFSKLVKTVVDVADFNAMHARAVTAEQVLERQKEALDLAGKAFVSMEAENSDLRERLRQREAELEQLRAQIS